MANLHQLGRKELLYLHDLHVGQRFISGTHLIDEEQIKAFDPFTRLWCRDCGFWARVCLLLHECFSFWTSTHPTKPMREDRVGGNQHRRLCHNF
jgi:hypothetical protein